jgi:hypothetical protein
MSIVLAARQVHRTKVTPSCTTRAVSPPELRKEIERLRDRCVADTQPRVPDAQLATTASLRQRNALLLAAEPA